MSHGYDYISRFLPFFDIPVSLDNLLERIASVNDRSILSSLDERFKKSHVFFTVFGNGKHDFFSAEYPRP